MDSRLRLIVVTASALALAAPAYAANGAAPGQVKKLDGAAPQTPAAPAPAAQTPATPAPAPHVPAAPQTKGTIKKVVRPHGHVAPVAATVVPHVTTAHPRAHVASHRVAGHHAHPTARPARPHQSQATHAAARSRTAASLAAAAAGRVRHASARPQARHRRAQPVVVKTRPAPFASISSAADRVIEVIPGAVLLALTGLTALVFLLIVRSWVTERRRSKALAASYAVTVEALAAAIEAKDHTTGGHIERVRRLGLLLARELAPRETRNPQMAYGFLLHDIGKLAVPDAILRAPGRLTEEQWALMRRHPEEGVRMLEGVPFLDKALDVVRYHHERWDGGGYPDGLRGEQIPLWARIFAVVDALDAMTADRPYRARRPYEAALEELGRGAGTQFDPEVVAALERLDPAAVTPLLEPTQVLELVAA